MYRVQKQMGGLWKTAELGLCSKELAQGRYYSGLHKCTGYRAEWEDFEKQQSSTYVVKSWHKASTTVDCTSVQGTEANGRTLENSRVRLM